LGRVVVTADHRGHDRARVAERLLDGARRADRAVGHLWPDAGLLLPAELAEELIEVADHPQGHHRTSAITRVAPTCSIAPHSPPYVARVSPRSVGARSPAVRNAERTRSGSVAWATVTTTPANQSVRPCCA